MLKFVQEKAIPNLVLDNKRKENDSMFNLENLKKAEDKYRSLWAEGITNEMIQKLSSDLGVELPKSYIKFLKEYGEGGITFYIFGIEDESYSSAYEETILLREEKNIDKSWIVIQHIRSNWEEYLICLDTSRMENGECPVIKYDLEDEEAEDFKENFYEFFNYKVEVVLNS